MPRPMRSPTSNPAAAGQLPASASAGTQSMLMSVAHPSVDPVASGAIGDRAADGTNEIPGQLASAGDRADHRAVCTEMGRKAPATPRAPSYVISANRLTIPIEEHEAQRALRSEPACHRRVRFARSGKALLRGYSNALGRLGSFDFVQRLDGRFVYSASDLNDYLECKRLSELEALVARHKLARPDSAGRTRRADSAQRRRARTPPLKRLDRAIR